MTFVYILSACFGVCLVVGILLSAFFDARPGAQPSTPPLDEINFETPAHTMPVQLPNGWIAWTNRHNQTFRYRGGAQSEDARNFVINRAVNEHGETTLTVGITGHGTPDDAPAVVTFYGRPGHPMKQTATFTPRGNLLLDAEASGAVIAYAAADPRNGTALRRLIISLPDEPSHTDTEPFIVPINGFRFLPGVEPEQLPQNTRHV